MNEGVGRTGVGYSQTEDGRMTESVLVLLGLPSLPGVGQGQVWTLGMTPQSITDSVWDRCAEPKEGSLFVEKGSFLWLLM